MGSSGQFLNITEAEEASLVNAARDTRPVSGLTHNFYRYPARFSPAFARAAIETFTRPGDTVLDNHVGGGTTLVESLALGRHAVGVDISALAEFVATVKTTVLSEAELNRLQLWAKRLPTAIDPRKPSVRFAPHFDGGYYKHLGHASRWRLRNAIEQALGEAIQLQSPRLEAFGRCAVLRTAQWALDGRAKLPSLDEFRQMLTVNAMAMVEGARCLRDAAPKPRPQIQVINRSAAGLEGDDRIQRYRPPRLVLTSPPYPGVHVLYHRWQVDGRKEAPAPFLIANRLDGAGSSYYTMGDRKYPELATYFANVKATMSSVAKLADEKTLVVQMIAFSDPSWQLERYLSAMKQAGLQEVFLQSLSGTRDGRLWRRVPNRRWYSDQRGETPGSQELVLIHRRRGMPA